MAIKGERKEEKEQDRGGRQKGGRKLSAEELMLLNYGIGEDSRESLDCKAIQPVRSKGDQS